MSDLPLIRDAFLKAVESSAGERDDLLRVLDPAIRTEVLSLLCAHDSAGDFLIPAGLGEQPASGTGLGPYRLGEKIAQGGMGVVYRATRADGEFEREVAIKFVGGRLYAPEAERRFITERRILALLDHPNIVRMIDGGVWQGQRYLVMEWVEGEPVAKYCSSLSLTEKLRLFRQVCAAIQYAHQRLVLHRDIKAANILVTGLGQVKVLDFGIARLLSEGDTDPTMLHPMSLSCASPEQLRGEPLTLSSDIYALGLLLCELLTGRNPQREGTADEIRRRVATGAIAVPSETDPKIPKDLGAIVLKAVSLDPQARYGSAGEMSADIGRVLDNRPVLARPPSRLYSAVRFIRRNRALSATAAALLLSILAGSGAAVWQAHRAEQNRQIAERRFADARRLVYTVIHDIEPKMARINGTVELRVQLIEKTLIYLEALRKDAGDNKALLRELVDGYVELAGVAGSMSQANVGDPSRAVGILKNALSVGETLERLAPADPDTLRTLGNLYRAFALQQKLYGNPNDAVEYAQKAIDVSSHLEEMEMAQSAWTMASVTPDADRSIALFQQVGGIWSRALEKNPPDAASLRSRIALVYRNLSTVWLDKKDFGQAAEYGEKARDLDEIDLGSQPTSPTAQLAVAFDVGAIGAAYYGRGQFNAAAKNWARSVQLREMVLAANPGDARAADRLGFALYELARVEKAQGGRSAARVHLKHAITLYEGLSRTAPLNTQSLLQFASSNHLLGAIDKDCRFLRRAFDLASGREHRPADENMLAGFKADADACRP